MGDDQARGASDIRMIRAMRLRNQGLVPGCRAWTTPAEVARGMLAIQAQDFEAAKWALSLRCRPGDALGRTGEPPRADVVAASIADGSVVRNRPSRGTLQFTAPEDLRWMTTLMSTRSNVAAALRRQQLGVTPAMVDGAGEVLRQKLARGTVLTRAVLFECFAAAGLPGSGSEASHLLRHHTQILTIVYAAPAGKAETYALAEDWIASPRSLSSAEALAEVAVRYFETRGPATVKDLAWWSNLTMADVGRAIELAGPALEPVDLDGTSYLIGSGSSALSDEEVHESLAEPFLLPAFDEYLLSYVDRSAVLAPERANDIVPGGNGMFRPIVVVAGEVVGTWKRTIKPKSVEVAVSPFAPLSPRVRSQLEARATDYGAYVDRDAMFTVS